MEEVKSLAAAAIRAYPSLHMKNNKNQNGRRSNAERPLPCFEHFNKGPTANSVE